MAPEEAGVEIFVAAAAAGEEAEEVEDLNRPVVSLDSIQRAWRKMSEFFSFSSGSSLVHIMSKVLTRPTALLARRIQRRIPAQSTMRIWMSLTQSLRMKKAKMRHLLAPT